MRVTIRIPVVVESNGYWHAIETYPGVNGDRQAMENAQQCAADAAGQNNAARIAIVTAEIECPAPPTCVVVDGTVTQ